MNKTFLILTSLLVFLTTINLSAQQSNKSKSKDRFREKNLPGSVDVRNAASINGPGSDYAPAFLGTEYLVFISNSGRTGPLAGKKYFDTPSFDIYSTPLDANREPTLRGDFGSEELNSSLNEGPLCFSKNGDTVYATRNNMYKGVQKADASGKVRMKIYQAVRGREDWVNVQELPFNNDSYSCVHPSLSTDGTTLYFASDMPGGFGGYDIYVCKKTAKSWSTPVNLGPKVNTAKNEVTPYINYSGKTLFFASNGHSDSVGGLDLYNVNPENPEAGIEHLEAPYNSEADDMGIIINEEGTFGYFASRRPEGHGEYDIYYFRGNSIDGFEKPEPNRIEILVTDGRTGQPIPGASIRILQPSDDGFISAQNDFYDVDLAPTPESTNSLSLRLVRKNADKLGDPDNYTNANGVALADFLMYRSYLVLASFDGYQTSERLYSVEPDKGGTLTLALYEEATCHRVTGTVATDKFRTRIASATLVFTHKESNQQVTAHTDENGEYELCLPLEGEYLLQAKREGFRTQNLTMSAVRSKSINNNIRMQPVDINAVDAEKAEALLARPVQDGYTLTIDKIHFEPGRTTLNQSAVRHLDALLELLQRYPEMEIDLTVHTDSRGDAKTNLNVSTERAKNAKAYLVYKGIEENRINADGKGESQLRNRCADGIPCSEAEHTLNNRIEVKVKKVGNTIKTP
jgi:outer membrane protein OmpA-like peptidoglycan-associated protein